MKSTEFRLRCIRRVLDKHEDPCHGSLFGRLLYTVHQALAEAI
jgi:hypothetical protein